MGYPGRVFNQKGTTHLSKYGFVEKSQGKIEAEIQAEIQVLRSCRNAVFMSRECFVFVPERVVLRVVEVQVERQLLRW